jgi:tetratricopeptide (TPR) repeat protein
MTAPSAKPNVLDSLAQINVLIGSGRPDRAEVMARQLHRAYPRRGDVNHALGLVLSAMGRPELAEPFHARAVAADGRNTTYLLNYGLCLFNMGRVAEAAAHYERAAAIEPGNPLVIWRLGSFRFGIGQGDAALDLFRKALALAPPPARWDIHLELVECLLAQGQSGAAEAEIRGQLGKTPHRNRYVMLLSGIGRHKPGSEVCALVEEALRQPKLPPTERSDLMVRLGVMKENSGDYAGAFETIRAAKALLRPPSPAGDFDREVDARIATFSRERIARLAARYGDSGKRPIFVVGLPRSGTTLTAQIISSHSDVGNAGELETMTYVAAMMRGAHPLSELEPSLESLGPAEVRRLADLYSENVAFMVPQRPHAVDKMPDNFRYCGEIAILFPQARIVHCRRHPGDTFISAFQNEMNDAHAYSYTPESYAARYRSYMRLMAHWKAALPDQVMDLDYERLTAEPRAVIGELLDFLGLDWQEACLHPEANAGTIRTFSRLQVRSAINSSSVGRWRNYELQLASMRDLLES